MNSSDSLLYNLSYLSSVIHPVIILRLLEHRLFTPLFKKKSVTSNPPPTTNPLPSSENKTSISSLTPNAGASALASLPTLPKPDPFKRQRSSLTKDVPSTTNDRSSLLTKFTHSTYDKHRKVAKGNNLSTSSSGISSMNSQVPTASANAPNTSGSGTSGTTANDISLLLSFSSPLTSTISASTLGTNSSNPPLPSPSPSSATGATVTTSAVTTTSSTTRKWFWRTSDKANPSNLPNDRNPLLQAIVENDNPPSLSTAQTNINAATGAAGVGEIRLLEKELLNLPTFQLSDSQNPLLPSPTCLNYDFPTQFEQSNPITTASIHRQHSSSSSSSYFRAAQQPNNSSLGTLKSKINDDDCKYRKASPRIFHDSSDIIKTRLMINECSHDPLRRSRWFEGGII